jgi:putative DNA primase/helicase
MNDKTHADKLSAGAQWYAGQGWKLLPCYGINSGGRCTCGGPHGEPKDAGKHPVIGAWNAQATDNLETVNNWWSKGSENNIGVYCQPSGFIVIDIDPRSGGVASFETLEEQLDYCLPPTVEAYTGVYTYNGVTARGRHLYYKIAEGEQLQGNLKSANLPGIDIKHNGYVMLAPSRHASGVEYEWRPGHAPWQMEIAEAPEELLQVIRKRARRSGTALGNGEWDWMNDLDYKGERVDIAKMLEDGIEEGSRAVDIYKLTCALANKFGVDTPEKRLMIETMMIRFNHEKVRPPLELEGQGGLLMHVRRAIDFVAENPIIEVMYPGLTAWASRPVDGTGSGTPRATTEATEPTSEPSRMQNSIGEAISAAAHSGISVSGAFSGNNVDVPNNPDALSESEGGDAERRSLSDIGNGRRLVDSFGNVMRYTPGLGWFIWDGQYWKPDAEDLSTQEISKHLATIIAAETAKYSDDDKKREVVKWAYQARANSRMRAAIDSAKSDPRIVNEVEAWDNNDHLFGVLNGVINLRTGELIKGQPDLHITKRAPVNYTPGMRNVRWEQFIDFATGGDKELQEWIQRAVGYTLTGLSNQDVLFLVYGPSGSGKNTFVETIVKAMGTDQYAGVLPSDQLAASTGGQNSSNQYYLAELRGKRMIWVDELPESERLNENQVKNLTGSSTIQGRSPGEKPFTFKAQGKLWITTNHRPIINDDAMWRRLRPIPWMNAPEKGKSDPDLKAYLTDPEGGLPAVLAWAVEGAIKYLGSASRDPLGWCAAVTEAAEMYRKNEDRIGLFLDEETEENEERDTPLSGLYAIYRMWSEERGERPLSTIGFTRKLNDRGLNITGQGKKAVIHGRYVPPRAVPSAEVDWGHATRIARNF